MIKKIFFDYDFKNLLEADYSVHEGSCITHQVHELKDIHESYGGFPSSITAENSKIRQLWFSIDDFIDASLAQLNIEPVSVSTILQPPGNIIPIHRDTFFKIKKAYPDDKRKRVRANIYLEDWKEGHLIHYQDHNGGWQNSTHWKAGDGWLWDDQHLHLSANAGFKNKYTLQISGFLNENTL